MSARDKDFLQTSKVTVADVASALKRSRQAVYRGVSGDADYLKPGDFTLVLGSLSDRPALRTQAKEAICQVYPDIADAVMRAFDASDEAAFDPERPAQYWFICGDLLGLTTQSTRCADQLDALCELSSSQVKIFVNEHDLRYAKKYEGQYSKNYCRAFQCDHDLSWVPTTLLRIDENSRRIDVFGVTDSGFAPFSQGEAARLRLAIIRNFVDPAESSAANNPVLNNTTATSKSAARQLATSDAA